MNNEREKNEVKKQNTKTNDRHSTGRERLHKCVCCTYEPKKELKSVLFSRVSVVSLFFIFYFFGEQEMKFVLKLDLCRLSDNSIKKNPFSSFVF